MRKTVWVVSAIVWLLLFVAVVGYGGSANLKLTDPTTWNDGSALTTITGHNFYYGLTKGGPYPNKFPVGLGTNFSINTFPTGTNYVVATVLAKNLAGTVVESLYSNEVMKVVDDRIPSPCTIE